MMGRIWKVLTRKKIIDPVTAEETRLNRVLNTFDLTALGVGSTLGVGVYVLAGQVAKDTAGPSVVLSFLIAAIASVFAGLCYAEFGARTPKAGSAYIYSYVCVGEFVAFVIGWNLILEYVIGSASVARALSTYLDTLVNNTLQNTFREIAPINVNYLSPYFDFFSLGISVLLAVALAFGLKESSMANNVVTVLNALVVLFVVVAGSIKADIANWHISPNSTNSTNSTVNVGNGGFFPFGVEGMIKGAATCFYGFVGFDCIATTGEEVKNPRKAIPISIMVSLFIIFLAYFGTSTVLTLMVPYYLQDHDAPLPRAFELVGWDWAKWVIAIGAMFGLCASLFGAMFPLPRIIYAMGSDGLVFKFLAKVSPRFQTPVTGTILAGVLTGLMSALFDLPQLVNMMSIGTLLAYTIVAASVLLLRYKEDKKNVYVPIKTSSDTESTSSEISVDERYNDDGIRQNFDGPSTSDEHELLTNERISCYKVIKFIFNFVSKEPNSVTEAIVAVAVLLYCGLCVALGLCAIYLKTPIVNGEIWAISVTSVVVSLTVLVVMSLVTQPRSKKELSFKVPLVPLIPALSILVNIYLMLMLDSLTWIRFAVWMAVGIPMYCMLACSHSPPQAAPSLPATNGSHYTTNITNGHVKMLNGISNAAFVPNEKNRQPVTKQPAKKKAAAPPPPATDRKDVVEVQQEAITDDLLDERVAIAELDEVLNDVSYDINDRKWSVGAVSDLSAEMSRSEDVVADVHCANVSNPETDPKIDPRPNVRTDSPVSTNKSPISTLQIQNTLDETSLTDDADDIMLPNSHCQLNEDDSEPEINIDAPSSIPKPPEMPALTTEDAPLKCHVPPTEEALKSVTLRRAKNRKNIDAEEFVSTSNVNLKVGSPEYKSFVTSLARKLNKPIVIPPLHYVPKKEVVKSVEVTPNENVIEESINQEDAKEKLKCFIESNLPADGHSPRGKSCSPRLKGEGRSKSVNETELERRSNSASALKQISERTEPHEHDFLKHKVVMEEAFRSIRLRQSESKRNSRRLSKTLGSSFSKDSDQLEYKIKMKDIFKEIQALKKTRDD